ncbi:MAG TPA: DMT family transporter [Actinomycetota bacterium]|nr:DMT family transporter [Actinomycetota bacterium]
MTAPRGATKKRSSPDVVGAVFILLTSLQFGAVVVLGRVATRTGLPVPSFLAVRFAVAAVILAVVLAALRMPLRAAPGEGIGLVVLGMLGYAVEAAFFFAGLHHGTAAAVTLLFFTYPVLVSLIHLILGRGLPGWLLGGALAASMAGTTLVVVAGGGVDIDGTGILFALGSALTFAFYLIGADAVLRRTNSLAGAMWVSGSASLSLAVFAIATGAAQLPAGWSAWGPALGTGAFTAGAFVCLFSGLRRLGAVRTSIISATEPLTAATFAAIFLGELVSTGTVWGGALILAGAIAASVARARPSPEPPMV